MILIALGAVVWYLRRRTSAKQQALMREANELIGRKDELLRSKLNGQRGDLRGGMHRDMGMGSTTNPMARASGTPAESSAMMRTT